MSTLKHKSRLATWYRRLADFRVEDLFSSKKGPGLRRTVVVHENLPAEFLDSKGRVKKELIHPTNQVITSKYTLLTFVPRNLLEQFRRVANVFFLGIAILQFFPKFSTISPGLVLLPLLIVLAITAIKDGYEDIKRHQSDRHVNHSIVRVLSGGDWVNPNPIRSKSRTFTGKMKITRRRKPQKVDESNSSQDTPIPTPPVPDIEFDEDEHDHRFPLFSHAEDAEERARPHWKKSGWEDVRVGDFVKILDNESIPADILICATSEDEDVAYVETKNLDGETNLKSRHAVPVLTHLRTAVDCASPRIKFSIDADRPDVNMYKLNAAVHLGKDVYPVDMQMVLLRGTVLRNTKWVIGVVMYTGKDTRIVMNSGSTPSKRSKVERQMNPQVFINLLILALMATACAIVDSVLEHRDYPRGGPWLYDANRSGDNPSINGLVTFAFALITFQNIVPISLYISIEFVRTCQAAFIYFDSDILYSKTGQATLARSWNLSDDLGQIEYVFSDKTGTLTQNSMIFRKCSIGGKAYYGDPHDDGENSDDEKTSLEASRQDAEKNDESLSPQTSVPKARESGSSTDVPSPPPPKPQQESAVSLTNGDQNHVQQPVKRVVHFHDADLSRDLTEAVEAGQDSANAAHARQLNGFFTALSLCHTVLTSVDPITGALQYKAQSPDEQALVQAAADVGFVFRGRDKESLVLQTPFSGFNEDGEPAVERYELLNILEFTSSRKRMSVIVRKLDADDGRIFLLAKGADNVIFERLRSNESPDLKKTTEDHLGEFASEGLRTLTLAFKVIDDKEYGSWSERYYQATVAVEDREAKIEEIADEIEHDLRLLGATAIEDELQTGVPETIADLKEAGIKVWVATGDKLETAIAIGYSTNLIARDSNIIVLRGCSGTGRSIYDQMRAAVEDFFPHSGKVDDLGQTAEDVPPALTPNVGTPDQTSPYSGGPLRRINTGISSIVGSNNGHRPGGFVLVIDGNGLTAALVDDAHKSLLLRLAMLCDGVICCRVSPLQKALIVKLVKDGLGVMTLAIGDGANDVSMIQAADVGVGISGEEGLQAVNSSDYAIAQFSFLKRLLFVHGHWSYARNGNMILNFFYKNIVCIGVLWWFQIYCSWSSTYVFEYTYLLFWNSFWTVAPVIAIGLFDRLVDARVLMDFPQLYRYGREGKWFGIRPFALYMFDGVVQSAIIFFIILYTYFVPTTRPDGYEVGIYEFSTTMVFAAVFAANFFNGLNTNTWTAWVFFAVFIGDILLWLYTVVYNSISPGWFVTQVWGNNHYLFRSAYFWLAFPLTVVLALLPRYVAKAYKFGYAPDDIDTVRYIWKTHPDYDASHYVHPRPTPYTGSVRPVSRASGVESFVSAAGRPSMDVRRASRTDMSTGVRSVHRGFDFSTEENGVAMRRIQSNLSERHQISRRNTPVHDTPKKSPLSHVFTVRRKFLRKKSKKEK